MRPSALFLVLLGGLALVDSALLLHRQALAGRAVAQSKTRRLIVAGLGLTDLSLATEARYTRHPAITDMVVPVMDHPRALEHFPTGSFWAVPLVRL